MFRLFSDLLNLSYDQSYNVLPNEIKSHFPHIPDDVIEQFLSSHSRNFDFQIQYENLDLTKINWCEKEVSGKKLIQCSIYPKFLRWVQSVSERSSRFNNDSWNCIDTRKSVVDYWANNLTWQRLPIFIHSSLIGEPLNYRLVEGHTRLGTLIGLIKNKIIDDEKMHKIWFGAI